MKTQYDCGWNDAVEAMRDAWKANDGDITEYIKRARKAAASNNCEYNRGALAAITEAAKSIKIPEKKL